MLKRVHVIISSAGNTAQYLLDNLAFTQYRRQGLEGDEQRNIYTLV